MEDEEVQDVNQVDDNIPSVYKETQKPTINFELPTVEVIYHDRMTPELQKRIREHPERFKITSETKTNASSTIYGLNNYKNSRWGMLGVFRDSLPDSVLRGTKNIRGTDGKIIIHNSKANQPPIASYTYKGGNGELINFDVTDEFITKTLEVTQETTLDGDTKEVKTKTTQVGIDNNQHYRKGRVFWSDDRIPQPGFVSDRLNMPFATPYKPQQGWRIPMVVAGEPVPFGLNPPFPNKLQKEPTTYQKLIKQSFSSEEEARIQYKPVFDQSDVDAYLQILQNKYNLLQNLDSVEAYQELLRDINTLPNYTLKRKVLVRKTTNPIYHSNSTGSSIYNDKRSINETAMWKEGFNHLKENSSITIIPNGEQYAEEEYLGYTSFKQPDITYVEEVELEIPISGAVILSSSMVNDSNTGIGNNLLKQMENQIKANATILGFPNLECSMVVEILGVGNMYSGDWYTTKVTHRFDSSGYFCDINFKKKTQILSKVTYDTAIPVQKLYSRINKVAQDSLAKGTHLTTKKVKAMVEEYKKNSGKPGQSLKVEVLNTYPLKISIQSADKVFTNLDESMYMFDSKGNIIRK